MEVIEETKAAVGSSLFGEISKLGHEQVVMCHDAATGLKAIIAIHNTVLGPALGGTRMWQYASDEEALTDVLRLSRGMTYKAAVSGLHLGGGKAVIIGDAKTQKTEAYLRRFGRFVQSLGGRYITAEDVNMKTSDMVHIREETKFVTGLPEYMGGSGDPSPVTAYGTFVGMKAAAKKAYGSDSLTGKKVAVQGVGQVGMYLVGHLREEGAEVFITDISEDKLRNVSREYGAHVIGMDEVYDLDMDIYAPCALGATLNDETIGRLKCSIVAGAANNQLLDEKKHGYDLIDRGIIYAPDFVINAGGLMNVASEQRQQVNKDAVLKQAEGIYDTTLAILNRAEAEGINCQEAAIKQAEDRLASIAKVKQSYLPI